MSRTHGSRRFQTRTWTVTFPASGRWYADMAFHVVGTAWMVGMAASRMSRGETLLALVFAVSAALFAHGAGRLLARFRRIA